MPERDIPIGHADPPIIPRINVVLVQYGSGPFDSRLIEALTSDATVGAVCVVRNPRSSGDRAAPAGIPGASLVVFEINRGYAAAANAGIAHLQGVVPTDVTVVLTPDVVLDPGCLRNLSLAFADDERLGAAGPLLSGTVADAWHAGGTWTAFRGARHTYVRDPASALPEPDWIDGAVLALRHTAFAEVGGFDEATFLYGEDVAFGVALRRTGWRVAIVPAARAAQKSGMARRSGAHGYLVVRNDIRTARNQYHGFRPGVTLLATAGGLVRAGWEVTKAVPDRRGLGRRHHLRQARGMLRGVWDGATGVGGPPPAHLRSGTDIVPQTEADATAAGLAAATATEQKLRLLEFITRLDTGGAQVHLRDLADGLRDRFDVHVAFGVDGRIADELRLIGITLHTVPSLGRALRFGTDLRALREVSALLAAVRPDVLHLHSSKAAFLGRIAARRAGIPVVYTVHGWPFRYGPPLERVVSFVLELLAGRLLGATVICVSEADARLAARWHLVARDRLRVIPNALPPTHRNADVSPPAREPGATPHIVMVARHFAQKDHATAIAALDLLRARSWHATFAGNGPLLDANRATIARSGLTDRIACPGDVADINGLLNKADVFLLCTHSEGNPISVHEAVRARLPIVATDLPQVAEAIPEGWPVAYAPASRPDLIAAALERMIDGLGDHPAHDPSHADQAGSADGAVLDPRAGRVDAGMRWEQAVNALSTLLADAAAGRLHT